MPLDSFHARPEGGVMKLKPKQFRCVVCQNIRTRGVFVTVKRGAQRGACVKVCKKPACATHALNGISDMIPETES